MMFPARVENLNQLENLNRDWEKLKLAIRPECRDDVLIEKAKTAFSVGLYDASINYFWNILINDLHKKIVTYGIDYFAAAINWNGSPLRNEQDLREVKDYQIISGCFSLGIIGDEAHFFLQQCREIRNNFSVAHYPMGQLDPIEATNFIKNCVKYVLTFDLPAPGLQIKELIEALSIDKYSDVEEFTALIQAQSHQVYAPILHSFFSNFIKNDCPQNLKHNIRLIAPFVWELVGDDVRASIGQRYASLKDRPTKDAASEAFEFLKIVNGISCIPETFKEVIFRKHAQNLIDAHMEFDNFYNEPKHSEELLSLGSDVPLSVITLYVKAVVLSFVGNQYGISRAAQSANKTMISNLSQAGVRAMFKVISNDLDVIRELMSPKPARRLKELMELVEDKTMFADQKRDFDLYTTKSVSELTSHFNTLYWNKVKNAK